jgi:hypothetical protein
MVVVEHEGIVERDPQPAILTLPPIQFALEESLATGFIVGGAPAGAAQAGGLRLVEGSRVGGLAESALHLWKG